MTTFKVLFLLIAFYSSAEASWSSQSRDLILKETSHLKSFGNAGYISYWGGIRRSFGNRDIKGSILPVEIPKLFKEKLDIYYFEDKQSDRLNVFFPGVFGPVENGITKRMINILENLEGSLLVIPNFFSAPYIKSSPIYKENSLLTDMEVPILLINKYVKERKEVHLYAESLGSYIGSSTLARLSNSTEYATTKFSLTLLFPPIEIHNALVHFDENIIRTKPVRENCNIFFNAIKTAYIFVKDFYPKTLKKDYVDCMESFFYHEAFVKSINGSYEESPSYDDSRKIETFFEYLKETRPSLYKNVKARHPETTLSYWLNKRNKKNSEIRILSAEDDFLNKSLSWDIFLKSVNLSSDSLILLPTGGHSGALGMPIWPKALQAN